MLIYPRTWFHHTYPHTNIGRTDVEAETPILWLPDAKSWLIWKDPDAEKDWRRRRRGWQRMRWLHGITDSMDMSLSKLWGVGNGQGGLACCSPWRCKESDTTKRLNWTELNMWKANWIYSNPVSHTFMNFKFRNIKRLNKAMLRPNRWRM